MKEIRMQYSEYEAMVELIKAQQNAIKEFKKESRVVLIDERYSSYNSKLNWFNNGVPKIVATDELLGKEYLKEEFDNLSKSFIEVKESLLRLQEQKQNKSKQSKKSFWWSYLNAI